MRDEHLALIIAGQVENLPLTEAEKELVKSNMETASILATELLAKRKGFQVQETELLRLKKEGKLLEHVPLYELNGELFIIYRNRAIKVSTEEAKTEERPKKKILKGGVKLP